MTTRELFLKYNAQTSPYPLLIEVESASGSYIFDKNGKKLLDMISGISVSNVGHRHPKVLKAIHQQLDKYMHVMVYGEFALSPQALLAKALVETLPKNLNNVYLVNSGSEAIDGAMKIAKKFTGKSEFVSCENAYHGSSQGPLSLMGSPFFKMGYEPLLPNCKQIRFGIIEDLEKINHDTCAIFIETVQGEAGVRTASLQFWKALKERCLEKEVLIVLDEIQAGFGRTGTFWAFEQIGIVPDILVSSKGMGGGMPIGAIITSKEIMQVISRDPILGHITTFGGHPVCCASSLATLRVIQEEELCQNVMLRNKQLLEGMKHDMIKEVRTAGLMMAIELESFEVVQKVIDNCLNFGLISDWFLFCDNSIRLAPPLNINSTEINLALNIIIDALDKVKMRN
ncbi:MAG: aspartate aminotransferase family protein [Cytophagales bacterium]